MLKFSTLASGSKGNAAVISCGDSHLLLDAGISARRIVAGLQRLALTPEQLSGIFITHAHTDHIAALPVLLKKRALPVFATADTCALLCEKMPAIRGNLRAQALAHTLELGELAVRSFATPHDIVGSVGYRVEGAGGAVALATDLGHLTDAVYKSVEGCKLLLCEANHDVDWVRTSSYPPYLKERILGDYGHLSNETGAQLAAFAAKTGAHSIILGHLSDENNTPAHARRAVAQQLLAQGIDPEGEVRLLVAPKHELSESYSVYPHTHPASAPQLECAGC